MLKAIPKIFGGTHLEYILGHGFGKWTRHPGVGGGFLWQLQAKLIGTPDGQALLSAAPRMASPTFLYWAWLTSSASVNSG